ncbi:MAG: phage/plasmid primase, P4 family [Bryobacteraceae bacterium]
MLEKTGPTGSIVPPVQVPEVQKNPQDTENSKKISPESVSMTGSAARFHALFAGFEHSHGQCDVTGYQPGGKAIANVTTHHTPATPELWARHLQGTYGLGVVPMRQDGTCSWGAVDLDDYETDARAIAARVDALGIPAMVCVSRSGGKHVFIFVRPVPASQMRQRLGEIAKALGYPKAELFPKQSAPTECGGNWLNMPWHGGDNSRRYAIKPNGDTYALTDFLDAAEALKTATGPEWFSTPLSPESAPVKAQKSKRRGFVLPDHIAEGQRNTVLTRQAGKLRRDGFNEAEILAALRQINLERCKPPKDDAAVVRISKSIGKKAAGAEIEEGLIQRLAGAITASDHFARDIGGLLYHFEEGCYKPTGRRCIEKQVKTFCEQQAPKSWTPELAMRVEQWLLVDAPELWERPPLDVLSVHNGLLNVESRILAPHSPDHLSPVQIAAAFDPAARCPAIDKFVKEVFPPDSTHLAAEVAAWLMLPDTSIQKSALLLGSGANGKSVWLTLLLNFLGRKNVSALSLHKLEADKFAVARLVGKLCNLNADLPTSQLVSTSVFKAITGGDFVNGERKYEGSFEFLPYCRLIFSANTPPRSEDSTEGFFRRWLCIPFNRNFDEMDPNTVPRAVLDARLSEPGELSGLLNRALDALPAIRKGRFTESDSTRACFNEFRCTTDPLGLWLDQETVERNDAVVRKDALRNAYSQVCQEAGRPILGDVQFTGALKRLRPKVQITQRRIEGKRAHVFVGLGFVTRSPEPSGLF